MNIDRARLLELLPAILLTLATEMTLCAICALPFFVAGLTWFGFVVIAGFLVGIVFTHTPQVMRGDPPGRIPRRDPTAGQKMPAITAQLVVIMTIGAVLWGLVEFTIAYGYTIGVFLNTVSWNDPVVKTVVIAEALVGVVFGLLLAAGIPASKRRYEEALLKRGANQV